MANQTILCFEISIQVVPKKAIAILINGGKTPMDVKRPQFTAGADPSQILCQEFLDKLSNAIQNPGSTISMNISGDGRTIIEDPNWVAPPCDGENESAPPAAKKKKAAK